MVYYRLKQTDFDGQFEYFNTVAVELNNKVATRGKLNVYPNPCNGSCAVTLSNSAGNQQLDVTVWDLSGKQVQASVVNTGSVSASYQLTTNSDLQPGMYVVRAIGANQLYSTTMLVQ